MSNAFTNFLGSIGNGLLGNPSPNMKDYHHASDLYVNNNYARAPKAGFLYFLSFNFNDSVIRDANWAKTGETDVGLLARKVDLPKYKISTETINQYNRKTKVQTKIDYEPITIEFHDDNSDLTNRLWTNYFKYYYTDSTYGGYNDFTAASSPAKKSFIKQLFGGLSARGSKKVKGSPEPVNISAAFKDTKYENGQYAYGLDSFQKEPFFKSIDIYVLHQQKFTQFTLVNPLITDWAHDSLDQDQGGKILHNRATIVYEDVFYNYGKISKGSSSGQFEAYYYDTSPSPLSIGGKGSSSLFGPGGIIAGADAIFGENGAIAEGNYLGAALQTVTLLKNASNITKASLSSEGYSIANSVLNNLATGGNQPGGGRNQAIAAISQTNPGAGLIFTGSNSPANNGGITATPVKTQRGG
jgi:hypothetical protein